MSIRIWFVTVSEPCVNQWATFTGWDRAACHERLAEWEKRMGAEVLEWRQTQFR
jgi:hypothetical protein